jgi:indole-3-glycerol phosphate synthase
MNILDTIIKQKKWEVKERKKNFGMAMVEKSIESSRQIYSLKEFILDVNKTGIIAEFKRRSPSKGSINEKADILQVTAAYAKYGASGISVLTDEQFFGGCREDFEKARQNQVPLLRKDFIIDEYQVAESCLMGADVILLIAACLSPAEVKRFAAYAKSLGMEVLLELHDEAELGHICDETQLVGVNNRDLKTFEVDIERSLKMAEKISTEKIKIAESGIHSIENFLMFRRYGFRGFLIGENFMKTENPAIAFATFVNQLRNSNQSRGENYKEEINEN